MMSLMHCGRMQTAIRYAIYYTPPPGAFAAFGASWLGWDVEAGCRVVQPSLPGLTRLLSEITATPRRYGFHATLKPPFRLAEGQDQAALDAAVVRLADTLAPVRMNGLKLADIGRFLALMPDGDPTTLDALAARVVETLDGFRAPIGEAERARRATGLSPRQAALLERWGYPYVLEEFRFHMTLTGPFDRAEAAPVSAALVPRLAACLPRPFLLDALSLVAEGEDGYFRVLHRYALSG